MKQKVENTIDFIDGNNERSTIYFFEQWYEIINAQKKVEYTYIHNGVEYVISIDGLTYIESIKACDE